MSDRDFYNLRELIRKLSRKVEQLERKLEEKPTQGEGGCKTPFFIMISKEEMSKLFDEMLEHFGTVADPRYQPKKFLFQLKSYLYHKEKTH